MSRSPVDVEWVFGDWSSRKIFRRRTFCRSKLVTSSLFALSQCYSVRKLSAEIGSWQFPCEHRKVSDCISLNAISNTEYCLWFYKQYKQNHPAISIVLILKIKVSDLITPVSQHLLQGDMDTAPAGRGTAVHCSQPLYLRARRKKRAKRAQSTQG